MCKEVLNTVYSILRMEICSTLKSCFTFKDDDSDKQERPQPIRPQRAKLPVAPSFKPSVPSRKPHNQQLCEPNRDSLQIIEDPTCESENGNTLPASAMISALSQILSTDPSSKYNNTHRNFENFFPHISNDL